MYDIDKTLAFLLVEARSQRAEDAFSLRGNAGILIQPKQSQPPNNVAPSAIASESALQLTLDKLPMDPDAGYLFGSSENLCDVLLDTVSNRGVSSKAFSIKHHHETQDIILKCLAHKGIFYREDTKDLELKKLTQGGQLHLPPKQTWIIVVGSVQIALSAVLRDHSEQQAFDRNLREYIRYLNKATPNVGNLEAHGAGTSTMETPDTRVFTGIWGNYTAAGRVGEGGMAWITACMSKTGVTCCVKEAKAGESTDAKRLQDAIRLEIICLRRVAHPFIVQYFDRDEHFTWIAMELASLGNLEQQHGKARFTLRETQAVIYQVLHALSHIHSRDILHHDIKPENILVQIRNGDRIVVKVADFGLSSRISKNPGALKGTLLYLAPECFNRPPRFWGPKIDVWALAMVALRLLFNLPARPKGAGVRDFSPQSPYAEGWGGALKAHFDRNVAKYQGASDHFCNTLSDMFESEPEARIGALEACENLRKKYPPGYFFLLGERPPAIIEPVPVVDTGSDDASIFRFRELNVEGLSEPLIMLEGCCLVNLRPILVARFEGTKFDIELATYAAVVKYVERYNYTLWRFKRTNELPEVYISIKLAMTICQGDDRLQRLVNVLREHDHSDNEGTGKRQLNLIKSIFTSHHIIAITEEGRMLLVRPRDGCIYGPSVQAVVHKRLLSMDELGNQSAYMPLDGAMLVPGVMSHDDIISLGAATYFSF